MGFLDFDEHYKPPFTARKKEKLSDDNFEELQNFGHEKVSEDYSDEIEKLK